MLKNMLTSQILPLFVFLNLAAAGFLNRFRSGMAKIGFCESDFMSGAKPVSLKG